MAIYMTLLRYTPEGMKAALAAGMTSRKAMHDTVISAAGGTTLGYYLVGDADWDVASLVEYPETLTNANAARLMAGFKAGGAIEAMRVFLLTTPEEFDAASPVAEQTYRPPTG